MDDRPHGEDEPDAGTLTMVCLHCGEEYYFDEDPPDRITCEQCGNHTFRSFYTAPEEDEVAEDFRNDTDRDLDTDDPATDVRRQDLSDLGRL